MARDAHNATWRALRRIVDVLLANVGTELTADGPAGLNVSAPAAGDYYVMPNERAVRDHLDRNHRTQVYVFPSGDRELLPRTIGTSAKSRHDIIEVTVAVRFLEEAGAADYAETWKTLTPKEREFYRCETLLGAIHDVFCSKMRGPTVSEDASAVGDDIVQVEFVSSNSGDDRFRRSADAHEGVWGSQRWRIHQVTNVPVQN